MEAPQNPKDYYWVRWANGIRYYVKATNRPIAKAKLSPEILPLIPEKDKLLQAQDFLVKLRKAKSKLKDLQKNLRDAKNSETEPRQATPTDLEFLKQQYQKYDNLKAKYDEFPEDIRLAAETSIPNPSPKPNPTKKKRQPRTNDFAETQKKYNNEYERFFPRPSPAPGSTRFGNKSQPQYWSSPSQTKYSQAFGKNFGSYPFPPNYFQDFFGSQSKSTHVPPRPSYKPPGSSSSQSNSSSQSSQEAPPPKINPGQMEKDRALLARFGIQTSKDWKNWMRQHHPDKNPDTNLSNVQEVNAAATRVFG